MWCPERQGLHCSGWRQRTAGWVPRRRESGGGIGLTGWAGAGGHLVLRGVPALPPRRPLWGVLGHRPSADAPSLTVSSYSEEGGVREGMPLGSHSWQRNPGWGQGPGLCITAQSSWFSRSTPRCQTDWSPEAQQDLGSCVPCAGWPLTLLLLFNKQSPAPKA